MLMITPRSLFKLMKGNKFRHEGHILQVSFSNCGRRESLKDLPFDRPSSNYEYSLFIKLIIVEK